MSASSFRGGIEGCSYYMKTLFYYSYSALNHPSRRLFSNDYVRENNSSSVPTTPPSYCVSLLHLFMFLGGSWTCFNRHTQRRTQMCRVRFPPAPGPSQLGRPLVESSLERPEVVQLQSYWLAVLRKVPLIPCAQPQNTADPVSLQCMWAQWTWAEACPW